MKKILLMLPLLFWLGCEDEKGDTTPPTVSILSPTANSTVSGTINIQVSASDDGALEKVELYSTNGLINSSSEDVVVHSFDWDTDAAGDNGQYILYAIAYDDAGNNATSASVTINVLNYRTITFTSQYHSIRNFQPPT